MIKIEFGCGLSPTRSDHKKCDIRNVPGIDYVCPAWEIDKHVSPNSVDSIFSRHFFEHLTFKQGEVVLKKWYDILKPGGECELILPNIEFHIHQWLDKSKSKKEIDHCRAGLWGWQYGEFEDTWDVHKAGYDAGEMRDLLSRFKFRNIKSLLPREHHELHFHCIK